MRSRAYSATLAMVLLAGCDPAPTATEQASDEEFEALYRDLKGAYGHGKSDIFDVIGVDKCALLEPLLDFGDEFLRAGLVVGVEGEGVLGPAKVVGGYDMVWDLYHHEMTVSRYEGAGLVADIQLAAGATVYVGAAFNFEHGVSEWAGHFVTTGASIGLPFLEDFLALSPAVFVSAEDFDENGVIDRTDEILFPDGVYGFTVGVRGSFDAVPDPLPVSGGITQGRWQPHREMIRDLAERLDGRRLFAFFRLRRISSIPSRGRGVSTSTPIGPTRQPATTGRASTA